VATEFFRAAFDRFGVHRAGEFSGVVLAGLEQAPIAALPALHYANFAAAGACLLVTALLYRNLSQVTRLAWVLFAGVMAAIAGVIVSGFSQAAAAGGWHMPVGPALGVGLALGGLAQATLITTTITGLLQHHLPGQRGEGSRANHSRRFCSRFCSLRRFTC